jgi:predicted nucleotidyltransferase
MQRRESQLKQVKAYLHEQGILAAWLYGRFASETADERSDIDLALLLPEGTDPRQLLSEVDSFLGEATQRTVNSMSIVDAPTPLAYEAIQGQLLFGEANAMLIEQYVWSKWEDWNYWNQ